MSSTQSLDVTHSEYTTMTHKPVTAHIRMTATQYEELKQEALGQGITLSEYFRHIIRVYRLLQGHTATTEG